MRIDIITLFPDMFTGPLTESIIKRAQNNNLLSINLHQLRDYALDKHGTVDDSPYGGGAGMVLKVDVMDNCLQSVIEKARADGINTEPHKILLTPQGQVFKQQAAKELAQEEWLILIAGHYEGFDERIRSLVDAEISLGDFILTGGELPAMVIVDAVARLLTGVLGKEASHQEESHENGLLEYPHYTRPEDYDGKTVPDILKSGDHKKIATWRLEQSQARTKQRRPDLIVDENRDI
jgi:tRNA (guanine37-N1)-methyltransferase